MHQPRATFLGSVCRAKLLSEHLSCFADWPKDFVLNLVNFCIVLQRLSFTCRTVCPSLKAQEIFKLNIWLTQGRLDMQADTCLGQWFLQTHRPGYDLSLRCNCCFSRKICRHTQEREYSFRRQQSRKEELCKCLVTVKKTSQGLRVSLCSDNEHFVNKSSAENLLLL